ncbi:hypothetical protein BO71DRAFT_437060 [Aspergillus ellipticus CBS 707.79]|uniref:Uncharacterized protein n=1 Tax=Aspergillus ellipticus CBS 707.79 TaxID=1448320 RepID=A0A319DQN1_9EURO|nr:hypothetical protein BO71DRAFT_437060 [Aspergillus ellipticus CBS 707.79]
MARNRPSSQPWNDRHYEILLYGALKQIGFEWINFDELANILGKERYSIDTLKFRLKTVKSIYGAVIEDRHDTTQLSLESETASETEAGDIGWMDSDINEEEHTGYPTPATDPSPSYNVSLRRQNHHDRSTNQPSQRNGRQPAASNFSSRAGPNSQQPRRAPGPNPQRSQPPSKPNQQRRQPQTAPTSWQQRQQPPTNSASWQQAPKAYTSWHQNASSHGTYRGSGEQPASGGTRNNNAGKRA